jgi:hypothetical protein
MPEQPAPQPDLATVEVLARHAGLALDAGRFAKAAAVLQAWHSGSVNLSGAMSAPAHQAVVPIAVLGHPPAAPRADD